MGGGGRIIMEDKIREYFKRKNIQIMYVDIVAHDIAEIAEKEMELERNYFTDLQKIKIEIEDEKNRLKGENTDLKEEIKHWQSSWDILTKENAKLKQQLKAVKMLNRDEVKEIINYIMNFYFGEEEGIKTKYVMSEEEGITAICNLAIPVIDKDRIIEVLTNLENQVANVLVNFKINKEQIANEILNNKGE